ncbi:hypothetical protein SDC9_94084 [bioreactor metagenome]|uniref:FAD-binding PCMH-type domain-containing protein n=1 Tax=bioreactor metagenome TaxID=1076179 RepID=A0A645A2G1_9ZZZZ
MRISNYLKPKSLDEAYTELISDGNNAVIGGGAYLKLGNRKINKAIDLYDLNLNYIKEQNNFVEIGAMTTLREIEESKALKDNFGGLISKVSSIIMGVQLRNVATIGGTIGGRYGFSDLLTALIALDTKVFLYNRGEISLEDFIVLPQIPRDIITKVIIDKKNCKTCFKDLRNTTTDFSIVNVAVCNTNNNFKIAIGARPGVAKATCKSMEIIKDLHVPEEWINNLCDSVVDEFSFGSDLRGSKEYRKEVAKVLVKRAVMEVL